jgi:hypothetical protein
MAKKDDQPSIKVEPRPTNGKRNGILAEEKHLDRRGLLRLGTWGLVAVGAVTVAVFANESSMKLQRNEAAAVELARQSQQIQGLVKENKNETRRLASAIDTLNGDRDRLFARITVLEEGLDSVTGSIGRQSSSKTTPQSPALPATAAAVLAPPPSPMPAPSSSPPVAENPAPTPAPTAEVAPVASTAPTPPVPEKPVVEAKPAEQHPAKMAATEKTPSAAQPVASSAPPSLQPTSTAAPAPLKESKSMIGPPESAAQKPIKPLLAPAKTAAAPAPQAPAPQLLALAATEEKPKKAPEPVESASAEIAVKRTQFGVDLGGANSVPGLRALWRGLLKTRASASLTTLQPIIVIRESTNGLGMQLRLVAGPFDDAAAAAKMCAGLGERACETTVYDGQRLTLKPGDEPAVANIEPVKAELEKPGSARLETEKLEASKAELERAMAEKAMPEKAPPEKAVRRNYLHHRFYAKKLPVPPPPPPAPAPAAAQEAPKPEPTTFSSFFRRTQPQPPAVANGS